MTKNTFYVRLNYGCNIKCYLNNGQTVILSQIKGIIFVHLYTLYMYCISPNNQTQACCKSRSFLIYYFNIQGKSTIIRQLSSMNMNVKNITVIYIILLILVLP